MTTPPHPTRPRGTGEPADTSAQERPLVESVVGRVGRPHGLRGDVVVTVHTDEPERRLAPGAVVMVAGRPTRVLRSRRSGERLVLGLDGVGDRTAAEELSGAWLSVEVDAGARPEDPSEYYDHQLRGLGMVSPEGEDLGRVVDVEHLPAQDLLVVAVDGQRHLVPFVAAIVPSVDLEAGRLVVDDPGGLLDDRAEEAR